MYKQCFKKLILLQLIFFLGCISIEWVCRIRIWSIKAGQLCLESGLVYNERITTAQILSPYQSDIPIVTLQPVEKQEKEERFLSEEDRVNLLRIVQAEAGGEDMEGKILVANVVLNRVEHSKFPDTVTEVVWQRSAKTVQFSPTSHAYFTTQKISDETREAVERALSGEDYSQGALFFASRKRARTDSMSWFDTKLDFLFAHGGHEFFK